MLFAGNIIKHPCFDEMRKSGKGFRIIPNSPAQHFNAATPLPVTDAIMRDSFWVGVYQGMSATMLDYMVEQIRMAARS